MSTKRSITSPDNPRIKSTARLRKRRRRSAQGRILIDGAREIRRAVEAGVELIELFYCEPLAANDELHQLWESLNDLEVPTFDLAKPVFKKICYGERDAGVVAVAQAPQASLADVQLEADSVVVVLAELEKPGNVGAVLRSADATGVAAVVLADSRVDVYSPNIIRASLGTVFTMPTIPATTEETLSWLRDRSVHIVTCRVEAEVEYDEWAYAAPTAVVLGNEAMGLPDQWSGVDIQSVRLPMLGHTDSLNVSATAAVLLYEIRRQRKNRPAAISPSESQ